MTDTLTITTNHVPRDVVDAYELGPAERAEFDYLDWAAIERGEDSASFVRYKGKLIDLGDLEYVNPRHAGAENFKGWDAYRSDTFFSGIVVRHQSVDGERVIVGRYCS